MRAETDGLPRLNDADLPPGASQSLRRQLYALDKITRQIRIIANDYYLFIDLARNERFANAIDQTPVAYGARVVVGSLIRNMVIGLAGLFDDNKQSIHINRVINEFMKEENASVIDNNNKKYFSEKRIIESNKRLIVIHSKINREPYKSAIDRIKTLRRKEVAHIDLNPIYNNGKPIVQDMSLILIISCAAVRELNLIGLAKDYDVRAIQKICRKGAAAFAECLLRGVAVWREDQAVETPREF